MHSRGLFALGALATFVATGAPILAQKQASTLERMTRTSDIIAHVSVRSTKEAGLQLETVLAVRKLMHGTHDGDIVLRELSQRHCGSACHGLDVGEQFMLFAARRGTKLVPIGGSRGLVAIHPGTLAAITRLLETHGTKERLALLTTQLADNDTRVREDAALALPTLRGLEGLGDVQAKQLRAALATSARGKDGRLPCLLLAAVRAVPRDAARTAWRIFADPTSRRIAPLAASVLLQAPRPIMLGTIDLNAFPKEPDRVHLAELLAKAGRTARPSLERLLRDKHRSVQTAATAALLELGTSARTLQARVGAAVLGQAQASLAARSKRRFRAIRGLGRR